MVAKIRGPGNIVIFSGQLGEIRAEIHALVEGDVDEMDEDELFAAGWQEYDIYED